MSTSDGKFESSPSRPTVRVVVAGHAFWSWWAGRDKIQAQRPRGRAWEAGRPAPLSPFFSVVLLLLCRVLRLVVLMVASMPPCRLYVGVRAGIPWPEWVGRASRVQGRSTRSAWSLLVTCIACRSRTWRQQAQKIQRGGAKASRLHATHAAHRAPTPCALYVQKDTRHKHRMARMYLLCASPNPHRFHLVILFLLSAPPPDSSPQKVLLEAERI